MNTSCTEGHVRLVDGSTANEGRIEFCRGGVWVAIYGSGRNYNHAVVVCRQLGTIMNVGECLVESQSEIATHIMLKVMLMHTVQ